jgi:hypothetical protein
MYTRIQTKIFIGQRIDHFSISPNGLVLFNNEKEEMGDKE